MLVEIQSPNHRARRFLSSFNPDRISLNPGSYLSVNYIKTTHVPFPAIEENSYQKKVACARVDLWVPLTRASLRFPSAHFFPDKTTGPPLCWYCLRRRRAGWSTPLKSEKYFRPILSIKKSSHPEFFIRSVSHAIHSMISYGIAVSWGRGRLAQASLLQGGVIDSPRALYERGRVWYIIRVGWGSTGSKCFDILPPRQP